MFNTSAAVQQPANSNSTGLFGNTTGPLQSTPTAIGSNALPNLFQTSQKPATTANGGGLFGAKLLSPTPATGSASLFNVPTTTTLKPTLFGNTNTGINLQTQQPQDNVQKGIGAYGVQINPLNISLTSSMPPPLVDSEKSVRFQASKNTSLINSFKAIPQKGTLLLQKQRKLATQDVPEPVKGSVTKPSIENQTLRKLTIDKKKIESFKQLLFKSEVSSTETEEVILSDKETVPIEIKTTAVVEEEPKTNVPSFKDDEGYWSLPNIETLSAYSSEKLSNIENFIIGRKDHGSIHFLEPVDLTHLMKPDLKENLFGRIVKFYDSKSVVEVYPDEFESIKPSVGEGLNVRAAITLQNVEADCDLEKFIEKLNGFPDNEFVSYDPFTKNWCFKVRHFSKYGLVSGLSEGHREIHSGRVMKSTAALSNNTKSTVRIPGFLNESIEPDYEVVEEETNGIKTHAVEIISIPAKQIILEDENIIKEMAYEPKDVAIEDLRELINENYIKSFRESKDLIEELKIANELGSGSIFRKNRVLESINQLDAEEHEFLKRRKIALEGDIEPEMEIELPQIKHDSTKISANSSMLHVVEMNSDLALSNDELPFVSNIRFDFGNFEHLGLIWKYSNLLFDSNKDDNSKLYDLSIFLNKVLQTELLQKNASSEQDLYQRIFEMLSYRDIKGAVKLSYETQNPQLSAILSLLLTTDSSKPSELSAIAKLQLEALELDPSTNSFLILIYKILANDMSLLESGAVDSWMCKLMALLNYFPLINGDFRTTLRVCFDMFKSNMAKEDAFYVITSIFVEGDCFTGFKIVTDDEVSDFIFYFILNLKKGYHVDLDEHISRLLENGNFESIYDNLFVALMLSSEELKSEKIGTLLRNNIDLVLNETSKLQSQLLINDDIIYTIQGEHYGKQGKAFKEINAYLQTKNNKTLVEELVLNKTGPYLIFVNKEAVLLDIISRMHDISDSVNILKIYAEFKLSGNRDFNLLNELVEKIESFTSANAELISFLYKFTVEQFIINFTTSDSTFKISLLNTVKALKTKDATTNAYLERVIKSLNV